MPFADRNLESLPVRQTIFGLEDGIVSTLGVVVGIAAGTNSRQIVILSALVVIIVESLSMAAGTYLSDKSEMEIAGESVKKAFRQSILGSVFMGLSYIGGGFISVLPFFFLDPTPAILPSIALSVLTLFIAGYLKGRAAGISAIKSGLEMSLVSLSAAALGYLIGKAAGTFLQ